MRTHIEQYIWELLENLEIDLDDDNGASELADECINNIVNKIDKYYDN